MLNPFSFFIIRASRQVPIKKKRSYLTRFFRHRDLEASVNQSKNPQKEKLFEQSEIEDS
jgi:hypothetical protein